MAVSSKSAQEFVPIKEVRDGIVVLTDGSMRATIMASSVNFALKSSDEQQALLAQFQNFLNSLDFSVQIFIQSRRLDIRPYIALLEDRYKEQSNDLLKVQTREYIEFIKDFTENSEIMTKGFFVVIPYTPTLIQTTGSRGFSLSSINPSKNKTKKSEGELFEETQTQISQRVSVVEQGLVRMGVRSIRLGTEEVIELIYKIMNPGELEKPVQLR
jgi:type IV secretory pathway VirB4 component